MHIEPLRFNSAGLRVNIYDELETNQYSPALKTITDNEVYKRSSAISSKKHVYMY